MKKAFLAFICCLCAGFTAAGAAPATASQAGSSDTLAQERKHFLQCLAYVYSPSLWFSYNENLYFTPMTERQARELDQMKSERSKYVALADRQKRHDAAAKGLQASGLDAAWQSKLLLPYSETNQNLTPTLNKPVYFFPAYKVLQDLGKGDALIQDGGGSLFFVMNLGRGADDAGHTNGVFVKEGEKTYKTQSGGLNTVEALASVGLTAAERNVLLRASAEFRKEAEAVKPVIIAAQDREEFELLKTRASDSNPYLQYLVAKAYLEGKGTAKDEQSGMDWMRRAAASGSGDAKRFLAQADPLKR